MEKDQDKLKQFLNNLSGEIEAIITNTKPTFQLMEDNQQKQKGN